MAISLRMATKPYPNESKTILVVEDDATIRSIVRIVLERRGYVLLEACDGADGLTVSRNFSGRIDLVVSDVRMPKMDGPEMVSRLQEERPGIKVLFISACSTQSLPHDMTEDFLPKPFLPAAIENKVQEVFARDPASLGQRHRRHAIRSRYNQCRTEAVVRPTVVIASSNVARSASENRAPGRG